MALIFRVNTSANQGPTTIKNAPLTYAEGDGNFAYLLTNMSGSTLNLTGNAVITGDLMVEGLNQSKSTSLLFYNASTKRIFYQPTSSFLTAGPGILINGLEITSSIRSVNGIFPTDGNVSVSLAATVTGTSASLVSSGSGAITASLSDGLVWIIVNDPDPTKNGDVFVYSSGSRAWFPAAPLDEAASDARYVKLDGANTPMTGHLNMGGFDINNVGTMNGTASFASSALSSSYARSASWAPSTPPGGSDREIQFNSGSVFQGSSGLKYNYPSQSLEQGNMVVASGLYSHAEGSYTSASATSSHAEGYFTVASGNYSHAEGEYTLATASGSHAEGRFTTSSRRFSHAEGFGSVASGEFSHAEGQNTTTFGTGSHAEGNQTTALGNHSHAAGYGTVTSASYQSVVGQFNQTSSVQSAFIIGNGTSDLTRSNLLTTSGSQVQITGSLVVTQGITGSLFGTASFITASNVLGPHGANSVLSSSFAVSSSWAPMRAGGLDTEIQFNSGSTFSGSTAFRFIYASQSLLHGIDEENFIEASGLYSYAQGIGAMAKGEFSHAEGNNTQALGRTSHAEGAGAIASGPWSHAEGSLTETIGTGSHAEGLFAVALGSYSHAAGLHTVASGDYQSVIGRYNISSSAQSAFIIGNGTDDNNRSNLLFASGSQVQISGSLDVNGTSRFRDTVNISNNKNIEFKYSSDNTTGFTIKQDTSNRFGIDNGNYAYNAISIKDTPAISSSLGLVGIFTQNPTTTLDVSGSGRFTNGLTVTSSLYISGAAQSAGNSILTYDTTTGLVTHTSSLFLPLTGGTINGDVTLNGTASIAFLNVTYESASVIYSSGSNVFGDATNDTQTLIGTVLVSGSQQITGSLNISSSTNAAVIENGWVILSQVSASLDFANDAAAAAGGVPLGGLYRNGNAISIRIA